MGPRGSMTLQEVKAPGGFQEGSQRASEGLHHETETHQPGPFQEIQRKGHPNSTSALIQRHRVSYTQAVQTASFSPR